MLSSFMLTVQKGLAQVSYVKVCIGISFSVLLDVELYDHVTLKGRGQNLKMLKMPRKVIFSAPRSQ